MGFVILTGTTVSSALESAFSTIASDASSLIQAIVPVAVPIMGAVLLVMIGIRIFKSIAKK